MDLRRVRLRLTFLYGIVLALAIALVTILAIRTANAREREVGEREGDSIMSEVLLNVDAARGKFNNTWLVSVEGERASSEPLGQVWLEPPLSRLARQAVDNPDYPIRERVGDGDSEIVTLSRKVSDTQAVVVAVDLGGSRKAQAKTRREIRLAGFGSWLLAMFAGWWMAGRFLRPARFALRQQREFIADAAHEMRTPLATIRASASQALMRDRETHAYRESLQEILDAASRARQGVDELLELARLEAGQVTLRTGPLRLDFLIEEVISGIRDDGCHVAHNSEGSKIISVEADYGLIRQALETLVRNAVARADNVEVRLEAATTGKASAKATAKMARIVVNDDGPGIPEELLPVVFDRFRRGDTKGGVGLGMAIARRIVELHDGTVEAANRAEGGASVVLSLPISRDQ